MKNLLIVSPHFPPVDTADMQRVRMSIPHFKEYGWTPRVLTIDDRYVSASKDPALLDTLPGELSVTRVAAVPERIGRLFAVGNAAIRAYPFLLLAGLRIIRKEKIDLVYFSTTQFFACTLAPIWKYLTDVPVVFDMQDPWVNSYVDGGEVDSGGLKRRLARQVHKRLESVTMPSVDGLVSVTESYVDEIVERHPTLRGKPCSILPFGASPEDFDTSIRQPRKNCFFDPSDGGIHGVYVGRGGADMGRALGIMFSAVDAGLRRAPTLFSRVRLHFVGTDYAPPGRARESVMPIARRFGVDNLVREYPTRVPYLDGINLLRQSAFLIVPGSDDPRYIASKIIPYLYVDKPLLAVFNEDSPVISMLENCGCRGLVRFGPRFPDDAASRLLVDRWELLLSSPDDLKAKDRTPLRSYSSEALSERQCRLFDEVDQNRSPKGADRRRVA